MGTRLAAFYEQAESIGAEADRAMAPRTAASPGVLPANAELL